MSGLYGNPGDEFPSDEPDDTGFDDTGFESTGFDDTGVDGIDFDGGPLEEELRQAAAVLDPVPADLLQLALESYVFHDLDARIAELTFDSLTDALPVRGMADPPRMLTFRAGELTVDVEVTGEGLLGQVLPPQPARIEILGGSRATLPVAADTLGRFTSDTPPAGPFALRLRTDADVIVTEWLRA
ncbi:hypothetical protein [Streptomyces sp. NPDC006739]|uniref:hypothetical protein n=1 Tax=Streptomyces sp. NPDC006739 TaxID=3364763 RepID=UPI0036CAF63B